MGYTSRKLRLIVTNHLALQVVRDGVRGYPLRLANAGSRRPSPVRLCDVNQVMQGHDAATAQLGVISTLVEIIFRSRFSRSLASASY